jgi:hypothetical protein
MIYVAVLQTTILPQDVLLLLSGMRYKLSPNASSCVRCLGSVYNETDYSPSLVFFARALMASRSGLKTSDSIVSHLVRKAIQIGFFATVWAIVALGTFFLFPQEIVYSIFDVTSGSIYTHVGSCPIQAGFRILKGRVFR